MIEPIGLQKTLRELVDADDLLRAIIKVHEEYDDTIEEAKRGSDELVCWEDLRSNLIDNIVTQWAIMTGNPASRFPYCTDLICASWIRWRKDMNKERIKEALFSAIDVSQKYQ